LTAARKIFWFARWLAAGAGVAAATYGAYVAVAWLRYGHVAPAANADESDPLLDRFMPTYDVVERHQVHVSAAAAITFAVASEMDLFGSLPIRTIFGAREWIMGSTPDAVRRPRAFLDLVKSIGWGLLAERSGQEIVMGAVTQPWLADVVFRPLPPHEFAAFTEPGYVKIAWTLRVDPVGDVASVFRTETRVATTDPIARAKFRRYWSFASPGILLVRRLLLTPLKVEAERRARALRSSSTESRLCRIPGRRMA
jgi:hypothetical protein